MKKKKRTQGKRDCSSLQLEKPAKTQRMSEGAALVSSAGYIPEVLSEMTVLVFLRSFRFLVINYMGVCAVSVIKKKTNQD